MPQEEVSVVRNAHQAFPQESRTLQMPEVKFSLIECIFSLLKMLTVAQFMQA